MKGSKNKAKVKVETPQKVVVETPRESPVETPLETITETPPEVSVETPNEIETLSEVKKVIVGNAEVIEVLEESETAKHCRMSDGTTKWCENYRF